MPQPEQKKPFAPLGPRPLREQAVSRALADVADAVRAANGYQQASVDAFAGWTPDHWGLLVASTTSENERAKALVESAAAMDPSLFLALVNVLVRFGYAHAQVEKNRPRLTLVT